MLFVYVVSFEVDDVDQFQCFVCVCMLLYCIPVFSYVLTSVLLYQHMVKHCIVRTFLLVDDVDLFAVSPSPQKGGSGKRDSTNKHL